MAAAILRFYNFPYRYNLGIETVRDAVIGVVGARQLQAPLIGSFSSLGPFTFGPWYAYQLIIFTIIFPYSYSPWIYLSIIAVIYVLLMYKIGEALGGKTFGLVLCILATFSPAAVISATHLTSHNNTNLFAALSILIFLKLLRNKVSYWWGFALGLAIGIGMNLHFQMSGLLILPLILIFYNRKKYFYFVSAAVGVFVAFIPLLFFELSNHWFNTRNLIYYIMYGKNAVYVPNRWPFYLRDFWPAFWADSLGTPVWVAGLIICLFLAVLIWSYYKKKITLPMSLIIVAFVFNFILLRYYWGPRFFGYLNFLRPFVFIFTTFTILSLKKIKFGKYLILIPLAALIILAMPRNFSEMQTDQFTIAMYKGVGDIEKAYPTKKFVLYTCSKTVQAANEQTSYSLLFLLDLEHKLDKNGLKVGLKNDCEFPKGTKYPLLSSLGVYDFSKASEKELSDAGWNSITFDKIYEAHARWWFKQEP